MIPLSYPQTLPVNEEVKDLYVLDVEAIENDIEADHVLPEIARRYLREEAMSLHHQL